jgi:hypothetical protein
MIAVLILTTITVPDGVLAIDVALNLDRTSDTFIG